MLDAILYVAGILVVLVGIALSIGLHELGHYLPAKIFGVKVKQFMIGFGPTVISWRKGETEFGIKAFPLGGYILMSGMFPPEKKPYRGPFANWIAEARNQERAELTEVDDNRQFHKLSPWKKMIVMLGGPVMNFFLGILMIITALSGIGTMQQGLTIDQVYQCMEQDAEGNCPVGAPLSPAALAGFEAGDRVTKVAGQPIDSWAQAIEILNENPGQGALIEVDRGGEALALNVTPIFSERAVYDDNGQQAFDPTGNAVTELRPVIGVLLRPETKSLSLGESAGFGLDATASTFGFILTLPQQVWDVALSTFGFEERNPNGAVSIVGVGQIAGEVTSADIPIELKLASLLLLIGSLNLALFAFNLIPLLPLDGGHVIGAVYESMKRRLSKVVLKKDPGPIDTAKALPFAYGMWVVLIVMGLLIMFADLVNPISLS